MTEHTWWARHKHQLDPLDELRRKGGKDRGWNRQLNPKDCPLCKGKRGIKFKQGPSTMKMDCPMCTSRRRVGLNADLDADSTKGFTSTAEGYKVSDYSDEEKEEFRKQKEWD